MAASRDFNALKGTERIIVYNERRPCYPMGYIPALTPNDDECVRTDCERPFNLADPYLHGGNDSDPIFTTRSGSRGCNQFGDSSPVTPKTAKLIAGASPNCFSPQSGSKGGKGSKKDDCVCQPARKRTKKVKCNTIPPDPRTGAGYPNVKQMAQEIEERVGGDGRKKGGGCGEEYETSSYDGDECHLSGGGKDITDTLPPKTVYDFEPIVSARISHRSSYEKFIPNFSPLCTTCQCDLEGICPCCASSDSEESLEDCEECDDNRDYFSEMWDSCMRDREACIDMLTIDCIFKPEPECCQKIRNRYLKKAKQQGETCCCECPPTPPPKPPPPADRCVCLEVDSKKTKVDKPENVCPPCVNAATKKCDSKKEKKRGEKRVSKKTC